MEAIIPIGMLFATWAVVICGSIYFNKNVN
jgi:hypothetical protein